MDRQMPAVFIVCQVTEQVEKLGVQDRCHEIECIVGVADDDEQRCLSLAQALQVHLIVGHEVPKLLDIEARKTCAAADKDGFCRLT